MSESTKGMCGLQLCEQKEFEKKVQQPYLLLSYQTGNPVDTGCGKGIRRPVVLWAVIG
jgi:hypothetical protein